MFTQANNQKLQEVSRLLAALLVKYPDLQGVAQRAFITYLRSIHKRRDKEIFDVSKLSIENFSASLGLPMTPRIRFTNLKTKKKGVFESSIAMEPENAQEYEAPLVVKKDLLGEDLEEEDFALKPRGEGKEVEKSTKEEEVPMYGFHIPLTIFSFIRSSLFMLIYVYKIPLNFQARNSGFEKQEAEDQSTQTIWVEGCA